MALAELTRESVLAAIDEYDQIGREAFLRLYGFGPARDYFVLHEGRQYDSKAIAGAARKFAVRASGALRPSDFSGGEATVAQALRRLGFQVNGRSLVQLLPELVSGQVYSWEELGTLFAFSPLLFQVGGAMISRPEFNALLLITHPGGARSFDYEDRWDGDSLIYTGRGKTGDQRLDGPNRDVAENRKRLLVFEAAGSRRLRYLGEATCGESWLARARDAVGHQRNVWKFRLSFTAPIVTPRPDSGSPPRSVLRQPRPFEPNQPTPRQISTSSLRVTSEEIAARQEQADREHSRLVAQLATALRAAGWTDIEDIHGAVDLWATPPGRGTRVLFEIKTLSGANEVEQCRAALEQLMEYRYFYGTESDRLCAVLSGPIADRRRALMEALEVAIIVIDSEGTLKAIGQLARQYCGQTPFHRILEASGT